MNEIDKLPNGWELVRLDEICKTTSGGTPSRQNTSFYNGLIPWVKSGELNYNIIQDTEEHISEIAVLNSSAKIFPKGTLLIALYGATIGKLAVLGVDASSNQAVCGIFESSAIETKFLFNFLYHIRRNLIEKGAGGAQPNISQGVIKEIKIPLPPFPEQHRIVSKIEELFSSLDKGVENLKTARQQLKVYRQAVLKWAFEGKLTNENVVDGELPEGWEVTVLGELADMRLGKMLDKDKNKGSLHFYLRNISVRWGSFDLGDLEQMKFEDNEEEKYGLMKGDLVICEGGEPGRCAIWNEALPNMKIQKALHRVRVKSNLSEKFLFYYMYFLSKSGKLEKYFTGTTIKHLTGTELKKISIVAPPILEQQAIVAEIESRLSVCDKIEESITQSLLQAEALRQSILKKAFEGKLVPQDPADEPASVLLERIKAEREKNNVEPKAKKVKKSRQTEIAFETV
jgi:type I restriction enzyme S subunit